MTSTPPTDRAMLRAILRQRRRSISPAQRRLAALRLAAHVCSLSVLQRSRRIAVYIANDGEIDPRPLVEWCQYRGKQCYAPVIDARPTDKRMRFQRLTGASPTRTNRFAIAEPNGGECLRPAELELVLLPLVGFDAYGNRLGMGGGFYDTTFARARNRMQPRPPLVGIAYECQKISRLPAQTWDIPLNCVVTDRRVYDCV